MLEDALVRALFNTRSPNAYELGESPAPRYADTPNESKGWDIVVPVRLLRIPIPAAGAGWSYTKLKRKTGDAALTLTGTTAARPRIRDLRVIVI